MSEQAVGIVPQKLQQQLQKQFDYSSVMAVPQIVKVCLNMGLGQAIVDKNLIGRAQEDLQAIAGQHAVVTKARRSIAGFKLREGMPIGCRVTLRRERMRQFLTRLVRVALPRVRDFRGLSARGFDGRGNYSLGIREHIIFPEIDYDKIDAMRGLDVTIVTSAGSNAEALALLKGLGFPFRNEK